jgi:hypothetical protein
LRQRPHPLGELFRGGDERRPPLAAVRPVQGCEGLASPRVENGERLAADRPLCDPSSDRGQGAHPDDRLRKRLGESARGRQADPKSRERAGADPNGDR